MTDEPTLAPEEVAELFGSTVEQVAPDDDELRVALVLRAIRSLLAEAAQEEGIGVTQLASRLNVSPSVISRMFRSEGDMRVSTATLCAHALGRSWEFHLRKNKNADGQMNHNISGSVWTLDLTTPERQSTTKSGTAIPTAQVFENSAGIRKLENTVEAVV